MSFLDGTWKELSNEGDLLVNEIKGNCHEHKRYNGGLWETIWLSLTGGWFAQFFQAKQTDICNDRMHYFVDIGFSLRTLLWLYLKANTVCVSILKS